LNRYRNGFFHAKDAENLFCFRDLFEACAVRSGSN
jgi:hypothetical protein